MSAGDAAKAARVRDLILATVGRLEAAALVADLVARELESAAVAPASDGLPEFFDANLALFNRVARDAADSSRCMHGTPYEA